MSIFQKFLTKKGPSSTFFEVFQQSPSMNTSSMLAVSAAATVFAAGVSFAVAAAVVPFTVVMMAAAEIFTHLQSIVDKGFCNFAHIAFGAAHHQDECLFESVDGTAADTAADKSVNLFLSQQSGKGSVSGVAGGNDFFAGDLAAFCFKDGEFGGVSEMLEHLMVFTGNCNFHFTVFSYIKTKPDHMTCMSITVPLKSLTASATLGSSWTIRRNASGSCAITLWRTFRSGDCWISSF